MRVTIDAFASDETETTSVAIRQAQEGDSRMTLSAYPTREKLRERNQFIIEKEAQLGRWRADAVKMEMEDGAKLTYSDRLIELRREMTTVEDQLEELKEATGDVWEESKPDVQRAWEALSDSIEELKREIERGTLA